MAEWIDLTDQAHWTNLAFIVWNVGGWWDVAAGIQDVSMDANGAQWVGFRPTAMRMTFTNPQQMTVLLQDSAFNTIGQDNAYISGVEIPLTFVGNDFSYFILFVLTEHDITKIEFREPAGSGRVQRVTGNLRYLSG